MTSDSSFHKRQNDRDKRLAGLQKLFQEGSLDVRKFRHLTMLLRAEARSDCRAHGMKVTAKFK